MRRALLDARAIQTAMIWLDRKRSYQLFAPKSSSDLLAVTGKRAT